ncbi:hypothetical protein BC827DRAFT_1266763 [Russula dissimulans]|nr:hypothetical protein BC827DRAFT_1266763 [Russula dissimulans]
MNNPKSVVLGCVSLVTAAGVSFYFAKQSINERRRQQDSTGKERLARDEGQTQTAPDPDPRSPGEAGSLGGRVSLANEIYFTPPSIPTLVIICIIPDVMDPPSLDTLYVFHLLTVPVPGPPSRPGRILLGGTAVIGGLFAGAWLYMSTKQARKASRDPDEQGALPSWEYRILHAVDPVRSARKGPSAGPDTVRPNARHADTVELRTVPPDAPNRDPDRSQHRAPSLGEEALRAENGAMMHPVSQRDRGDGANIYQTVPVKTTADG